MNYTNGNVPIHKSLRFGWVRCLEAGDCVMWFLIIAWELLFYTTLAVCRSNAACYHLNTSMCEGLSCIFFFTRRYFKPKVNIHVWFSPPVQAHTRYYLLVGKLGLLHGNILWYMYGWELVHICSASSKIIYYNKCHLM